MRNAAYQTLYSQEPTFEFKSSEDGDLNGLPKRTLCEVIE
jgi:hypothetical protein